ncbi:unnamed protein product (macronuclear) [Paramecium tetraurelia]|uniref:Anaphase-promoting complex subunit 4 WD40 domain-containing protein n=1 Tax=Paramecium tetraurelia TaxID=5888 RepID=A0D3E3_PARTE|nr:uncharacterized protein GSPATT00013046001 [Paramecium tetraurelia]CAK77560.1 unnamed protein product [Paramecium tetraurelia]|eukprot:XP_001444957.1 hypothetical protein (macronuclear) [Paramecium tetraurelia strain d4-2]
MRQNISFQPQTDDKNVFQSNSSNIYGTGRFGDIRPKNITFQGNDSQHNMVFDPNKVQSSQHMTFYKQNDSNRQSGAKVGSQIDSQQKGFAFSQSPNPFLQQSEPQEKQQFSSQGSDKKKGASDKYFKNGNHQQQFYNKNAQQPNFEERICEQHGNAAKFICTTVGCLVGGLCEECQHQCPNITDIEDYFRVLELKLANQQLDVIQNEKFKSLSSIRDYFNQIRQDIINQIDELEIKFIAKVINETSFNIELPHQFVQELFETNLIDLTRQTSQLSKLIYNDFLKVSEFSKVFVSDQSRFQKKLQKNIQLLNQLFSNFIYCCEQQLLNCVVDHSELNLQLIDQQSQFHQSKTFENQMKNLKSYKTIQNKSKNISDICLISNSMLASAEENGEITLWKLPYFVQIHKFQHGVECISLAAIKDNQNTQFLLSAGKDRDEYQIYLWNVDLRSRVGDVIGHSKQLRKIVPLAYSQIAWCQDDSKIRVWKLNEKELAHELNVHSAWINDLCKVSRTQIASCSRDYTVAVIDYLTGKTKFIIKDVTYVNCVTSINSELFAFANYNGQLNNHNLYNKSKYR